MTAVERVYTYGIYHWQILRSSSRKFALMGLEPMATELRSDALTDWTIRPWVQLAIGTNIVQLLQFHGLFSVTFLFGCFPLSAAVFVLTEVFRR